MKLFRIAFLIYMVFMAIIAIYVLSNPSTESVREYKPSKTEESSCSMPMCESLGGHDAIALQVMFGD